jgi:hypothetical protein
MAGPYLLGTAIVGGVPTPKVDDPIAAVMIALFFLVAIFHMTWRLNQPKEHVSKISLLLFIFSMTRIVALVMRMTWASHPTNINIAIAAQIFLAAGVLIFFVINLIFARRVLGDYTVFGRHKAIDLVMTFLIACVAGCLIMVIVATVYSFFTLDPHTRQQCRDIQLVSSTYLALLAFIPIPTGILALMLAEPIEDRKHRKRFHARLQLLLFTATLLTLGAGFRTGTAFDARPQGLTTWFHHKAAFYCFNFAIEIICTYTVAIARFDRRFRLGHLRVSDDVDKDAMTDTELPAKDRSFFDRINNDREVFGREDWKQ